MTPEVQAMFIGSAAVLATQGPTFIANDGSVWMASEHAPVRLPDDVVERLLTLFEDQRAVRSFLELYSAYLAVGGIERCTSLTNLQAAE